MISNLAITTPVIGSIRLGDVVVNDKGKRLPVRTNHFNITALFKDDQDQWVRHPMHDHVAKTTKQDAEKITEIPVRLMFNSPDLNMRSRYEAFDNNGRIVCAGDGQCARRVDGNKVVQTTCPGAEHCEFGRKARCDLFARLNVIIEGQEDEFSSFILRTESVNAVRTLEAKIKRMAALFGGRLIGIPFLLKLRQKASSASYWTKFWYADLVLNNIDQLKAAKLAKEVEEAMIAAGLDQQAMEQEALAGLQNGAFEDGSEDFADIEAFLLARNLDGESDGDAGGNAGEQDGQGQQAPQSMVALRDFLNAASDAGVLNVASPQAVAPAGA